MKLPPATAGSDGAVTVVDFDAAGNARYVVDPLGKVAERQYDARDRLVASYDADPDGSGSLTRPLTQLQYDAASQLTHVLDPLGRDTSYSYDGLGRQVAIVAPDPDGAGSLLAPESQFVYDAVGNVVESRERSGASTWLSTLYAFDNLDRITSVTDPNSQVTSFTYDKLGKRLTLTDPDANTTTWSYDNLNRVKQETNPLGASRYFHYDTVGNLTSQTDRNSRVTTFAYDRLDHLTSETWVNGNRTLSYTYNAAGELLSAGDSAASYQYTLDDIGRPITTTETRTGLSTITLNRAFDLADRQTQLAVSVGGVADLVNDYAYDALGRVTSLTQHAATQVSGQPTPNAVAAKRVDFAYNSASQFQSLSRYADLAGTQLVASSSFGYDGSGRLTSLVHTASGGGTLANYGWSFDQANRLTGFTNGTHTDESATYSYDNFGQLTGADRSGTSQDESFSYDANGNRTGGGYQVGANNRLTNDGTYSYTYDAEGNRTRRTKTSDGSYTDYTWDFRNRLTNVTEKTSGGTVTKAVDMVYDIFDRWIGETVDADGVGSQPAVTKRYVYDGTQLLLAFENGSLQNRYLWGPAVDQILADEVVASTSSPGTNRWMLTDNLNSVRDVVSNSGTVLNHLAYSSFGILVSQTNSANQPLILWTGRPFDAAIGLQHNWHRWYDPAVGKWASEDPIGFGGGDGNIYRYVGNRPEVAVDPTGYVIAFSDQASRDRFLSELKDLGAKHASPVRVPKAGTAPQYYVGLDARDADAVFKYADKHFPVHDKAINTCKWDTIDEETRDLIERRNQFLLAAGVAGFSASVTTADGMLSDYSFAGIKESRKGHDMETAVTISIGGELDSPDAINVNIVPMTTVEASGNQKPIPHLFLREHDCDGSLPFTDKSIGTIRSRGTPLRGDTPKEIARIIKPDGTIVLINPDNKTGRAMHQSVIDAVGKRGTVKQRSVDGMLTTTITVK